MEASEEVGCDINGLLKALDAKISHDDGCSCELWPEVD
jgi:hypothetical protein